MIEAFLLTVFVFAAVVLAANVSRKAVPGQQLGLGVFSYKPESEQLLAELTKK